MVAAGAGHVAANAEDYHPIAEDGLSLKECIHEVVECVQDHVGRNEILFLVLVVGLGILGFTHKAFCIDAWARCVNLFSELGPYAVVPIALLCIVSTCVGFPVDVWLLWSGAFFESMYGPVTGAIVGIAACCVGVYIGCLAAFVLGKTLLRPRVQAYMDRFSMLRTINSIIEGDGWKFAFIMRMSPLIPNEPLNYACSMTSMSFKHMALSTVGSLPKTAYEVWLAAQAANSVSSSAGGLSLRSTIALNLVILLLMAALCVMAKRKYDACVRNARSMTHTERSILLRRKSLLGLESAAKRSFIVPRS